MGLQITFSYRSNCTVSSVQIGRHPNGTFRDMEPVMIAVQIQIRKYALISSSLDALGMGTYQWGIFFLCGYGYFLDLAWAQAFSLILGPMTQEFGVSTANSGQIFTAFSAGLTAGAFVWGVLVDVIGRKWAFNLTTLICSVFGLVIGTADSWAAVCVLAACCGFGLGGNIPIDATILLEFVPKNRRALVMLLSIFQPLGVVACSLLAWALVPPHSCAPSLPSCSASSLAAELECCTRSSNSGWRNLLFTLGALTLACFLLRFGVFRFRESPRFLLSHGKDKEAVAVVHAIFAYNGVPCSLRLEELEEADNRGGEQLEPQMRGNRVLRTNLKSLFGTRERARVMLLVCVVYMFDYWGFSIAGAFLPSILRQKGAMRDVGVYETYRNYILISLSGLPGVLLGAILVDLPLGRKWSMVFTSSLMATSLFLFVAIDSQLANVLFNALEYFFQSAFNAVLYGYAPELFPTSTRGTAVGLASSLGRLTSILSPLLASHLLANTGSDAVLYLAGGGTMICALAAVGLRETRGGVMF
ncbi:MFS general substrate transporter [Dacryopinax primogenitus]|uniref:MFS general substrate transporter n=1 Tax=Dacryopinax primogenitus (strain DJM 731) TaxID=1858805 RepID=M5FZF8_DACPD|nr:MFS general substrate transporter [Dacryopinax primogenitus]EJU01255.1 MFS general substrate transporter [Dacryopinax primogenitus]